MNSSSCSRTCRIQRMRTSAPKKYWWRFRTPHSIDQHDLHVTGSIGIATYPDDGVDADTLMQHADLAMYHAKESGRNNFQFYKAEMNARAVERHSLEDGLRQALERQEFVLHYQPKMNLATGAIDRCRGADPLASSATRTRASRAVHSDSGRVRIDRGNRPVGPARSLPSGPRLAGRRPAADPHRDQYLRGRITRRRTSLQA